MSFFFRPKTLRINSFGICRGEPASCRRRACFRRTECMSRIRIAPEIKAAVSILILVQCVFALACYQRKPAGLHAPASNVSAFADVININTASPDELQRIPHVGEKLASKIVEHRELNGPFRRVEHLMLIPGISDKRFRKIRPMVRVE
jgi:competence ComEA-like helix-hairpin-helix protein